jgi:hypothetical protein
MKATHSPDIHPKSIISGFVEHAKDTMHTFADRRLQCSYTSLRWLCPIHLVRPRPATVLLYRPSSDTSSIIHFEVDFHMLWAEGSACHVKTNASCMTRTQELPTLPLVRSPYFILAFSHSTTSSTRSQHSRHDRSIHQTTYNHQNVSQSSHFLPDLAAAN